MGGVLIFNVFIYILVCRNLMNDVTITCLY